MEEEQSVTDANDAASKPAGVKPLIAIGLIVVVLVLAASVAPTIFRGSFLPLQPFQQQSSGEDRRYHEAFQQAYDLAAAGDLVGAEAAYTRAIGIRPNDFDAYWNRALVRRDLGDLQGAIDDATTLLKQSANNVEQHTFRGELYYSAGQIDEALADYEHALRRDPGHVAALAGRGAVKVHMGKLDSAIADFTNALALRPDDSHSAFSRGHAHAVMGNWAACGADLLRAESLGYEYPEYLHLWLWVATANLDGRVGADVRLRSFLAKHTSNAGIEPWTQRVMSFLLGNLDHESLLAVAEISGEMTPNQQRCEAHYYIGACRLIDGDQDGAIEHFKICLETQESLSLEYIAASAQLRRLGVQLESAQDEMIP